MRSLRVLLTILLSAVLLMACRPAPVGPTSVPAQEKLPLLSGQLLLPGDYATQATSGQVRSNATVTLIDPANFQAKGTGLTAADGTFTIQSLPTFTPTLGALYLLESTKTLGTNSSAMFRLRTLVQFNAGGWTSISGAQIQLSAETTAVSILWYQHGLSATDVIGKVTYEATTRSHRFGNLTSTLTEPRLREIDALVIEALGLNLDPIQTIRPGPNGQYQLSLADKNRNMLQNAGFEEGETTAAGWSFNAGANVASYSVDGTSPYEGQRAIRLTVTAAGDTWYGQGFNGTDTSLGIKLATGSAYTVSVYAKGAAGGEKMAITLNYQTPFTETSSPVFTLTTTWQRYTWTFMSSHSTDRAIVFFRYGSLIGDSTFPRTLHFDGTQFEAGGAVTPLQPQGRLMLEGFANSLGNANLTPIAGKRGRGIVVDQGLNLLPNSSFEADSNSDGLPDGMSPYGTGGTYSLDPDALFHARALKIVKATPTPDCVGVTHTYNYRAGKTYSFSVWVRGENVSGSPSASDFGLYVDPFKTTGGYAYGDIRNVAAPTGTFGWTRLSYTHTFINECSSAKIYPIFRNKSGTVWFDGLQVEENAYASPYAGDGPDRLTFDAGKYVNRTQGTIAYRYCPTYDWEDTRGNGTLLAMDHPGRLIIFSFGKGRGADGRTALTFNIRQETATQHDWFGAVHSPASPAWRAGEWHHLAMTWGPGGMVLYLDGAPVGANAYNGPIWSDSSAVTPTPNLSQLYFAGLAGNFTAQSNGALDGLEIWDAQQSAEAIRRDYLGL